MPNFDEKFFVRCTSKFKAQLECCAESTGQKTAEFIRDAIRDKIKSDCPEVLAIETFNTSSKRKAGAKKKPVPKAYPIGDKNKTMVQEANE